MQAIGPIIGRIAGALIFLSACGDHSQSSQLPDITSESEEGFQDLVFSIRDHQRLPSGVQTFHAYGRHDGKEVGLAVSLGATWGQVSLGSSIPNAFRGTVDFVSLGAESDALLSIMDSLYGTGVHPLRMNETTEFTAITLEGDPRDPSKGIVKIKLFVESDDEQRYAELYTNIDVAGGKLYVSEKDVDYRTPVIKALAATRPGG